MKKSVKSTLVLVVICAVTAILLALTNAITASKAQGLRLSAVMSSSLSYLDSATAALVDSTIAAELYTLGFHEILLTDILPGDYSGIRYRKRQVTCRR